MGTKQEKEGTNPTQNPKGKKHIANLFWWWKNPTDRFAFFLVVVTFFLVIATVGLYCATSNLVDETRKTSERQLRAYVGIAADGLKISCPDCINPVPDTADTNPLGVFNRNKISMIIRNFGQTPAYHPVLCAGIFGNPKGRPIAKQENERLAQHCASAVAAGPIMPTIWPSEGRPYSAAITDRQGFADIASARANTKDAYFRGAAIYHDIFGNERWSNFCFQYVQSGSSEGFIGCATHATEDK
jgi:hypothetical protein